MSEKSAQLNTQGILQLDGYLEPFLPVIERRHKQFQQWKDIIFKNEGGYDKFTKGYEVMGFTVKEDGAVVYREWAPNAQEANLIGDFSWSNFTTCRLLSLTYLIDHWNRVSHPMTRNQYGIWEITLPPKAPGEPTIPHDSKLKVNSTLSSVLGLMNTSSS